MQIIVIKQETDELISIEVPHDANAELLVQMVQSEVGIPVQELRLEVEGVPIRGGSLIAQGVVDGTAIIARREAHSHHSHPTAAISSPAGHSHSHAHSQSANHPPPAPARNQQVQLIDPSSVAPERLLEFIRENPSTLVQYKRLDPELGTLIEEGDAGKIRVLIMKRAMSRHKIVYEAKMEEIALHTADPMDPEVQKKIAERVSITVIIAKRNLHWRPLTIVLAALLITLLCRNYSYVLSFPRLFTILDSSGGGAGELGQCDGEPSRSIWSRHHALCASPHQQPAGMFKKRVF